MERQPGVRHAGGQGAGFMTNVTMSRNLSLKGVWYCDEKLRKVPDADFDYTPDTLDNVGVDKAWGFCDKKCFASKSSIMANVLQRVLENSCCKLEFVL